MSGKKTFREKTKHNRYLHFNRVSIEKTRLVSLKEFEIWLMLLINIIILFHLVLLPLKQNLFNINARYLSSFL